MNEWPYTFRFYFFYGFPGHLEFYFANTSILHFTYNHSQNHIRVCKCKFTIDHSTSIHFNCLINEYFYDIAVNAINWIYNIECNTSTVYDSVLV